MIKNIRILKNSKACGLKSRYAEMVKSRKNKLYRIITTIMNQCLNGENGQAWKNISPQYIKKTIRKILIITENINNKYNEQTI